MHAILIKPSSKSVYSQFMELIKTSKSEAKILSEDEELDLILSDGIEEGMKTGKASKERVKKFLFQNNI